MPKALLCMFFVLAFSLTFMACKNEQAPDTDLADPHSFAKPLEAQVVHLNLDILVDFDQQKLSGKAVLQLEKTEQARELWLDSKGLSIERVLISPNELDTKTGNYRLGELDPELGQALIIELEPNTNFVHIHYSTEPGAEALQFLSPELTAGGKYPFLLTQSQSIFARTWVPIQDSPGIRFSYQARVQVPPGLMALMSAKNPIEANPEGLYQFEMRQPIPAYLLALAVGDIKFASLGARTGVYAEAALLEAARYEFAEINQMMQIAEQLYGPYRWGRYDIVVLPPSFPFGGMENPRLTFATPTILVGDRSLVSLIAHELAHSWSGNLVTNATWNDFWLNEGFTVYFENRIMEGLKGKDYAEMLAQISYEDLLAEIEDLGVEHPDTRLALNLKGRNPDEGMTSIAYDKGYYFLRLLEQSVGREAWDAFLRQYFDQYAFKTIDTQSFLSELEKQLFSKMPEVASKIKVEQWVYGTGLPDNLPKAQSIRLQSVESNLNAWIAGKNPEQLETENWSSHEWLHFIRTLPKSLSLDKLAELDATFDFTNSKNAELQCAWYVRALEDKYEPAYPAIKEFLMGVGRRKFLDPIYKTMVLNVEGQEMANQIYAEARQNYHPLAQSRLDQLLNWQE